MTRPELRRVVKTVDEGELENLYALYVETGQEERLQIIEAEEKRRRNPKHQNRVMPRKVGLKARLS